MTVDYVGMDAQEKKLVILAQTVLGIFKELISCRTNEHTEAHSIRRKRLIGVFPLEIANEKQQRRGDEHQRHEAGSVKSCGLKTCPDLYGLWNYIHVDNCDGLAHSNFLCTVMKSCDDLLTCSTHQSYPDSLLEEESMSGATILVAFRMKFSTSARLSCSYFLSSSDRMTSSN